MWLLRAETHPDKAQVYPVQYFDQVQVCNGLTTNTATFKVNGHPQYVPQAAYEILIL